MLEQEIASLIHFIRGLGLVTKEYFGELPEGVATPSVYYPVPDVDGRELSFDTYENEYSLFINIFDKDTRSSYNIASAIVNAVQSVRKKIPVYDETGVITEKSFWIDTLKARPVDRGVSQVEFSWRTYHGYKTGGEGPKTTVYIEGLPVKVDGTKEDEEVG
jgi:hypothetical protein